MESVGLLDRAGRRRSQATLSGFHQGRVPRNKGLRYPPDPPPVEEIIAVMRAAGDGPEAMRLRGLIIVLWRAGLRISEALALAETDLDRRRVPGVNVIAAATFLAAVGDIARFRDSRKLIAYLGLDPRVRQSGDEPARPGRISKRGSASARWALVEAAWSVVQQPGPLRAFYERIKGRRGHGKAIVAAARKLAVLFWCLLSRGEDYAHQQPSLTALKLRRLEVAAGAPTRKGKPSGTWATRERMRQAEKQLAAQAQASYERTVRDWQAVGPKDKAGASVTAERA